MARKRAEKEPAEQEAAMEATEPAAKGTTTKADAVRAALAEGIDQPEEGVAFVKERFGLDITRPQFSTYKSLSKKKDGAKKPGRPKAAVETAPTPAPSSNGPAGLAIQVEAIKTLVDTLGIDQVVSIARLFAK